MRPFNYNLYARSAERALRRIALAGALDAASLRGVANEELQRLRQRYRNNGYWNMQPDQRAAQEQAGVPR